MIIDGYRDVKVFSWIRRGKSRKRSRGRGGMLDREVG